MFLCTFAENRIFAAVEVGMPNFGSRFNMNLQRVFSVEEDHFMVTIEIKDKQFRLYLTEDQIAAAISRMAERLNRDLVEKDPLFICVLNGAFVFAADLMRKIEGPSTICFVRYASYNGLSTIGTVSELMGLTEDIEGRTVVVLEDIVDTGITISNILGILKDKGAAQIKVATLLFKPAALQYDLQIDYVALEIPNDFIVGYGLDYDGYGRNLKDIYTLC